jgi:hypothetical protein
MRYLGQGEDVDEVEEQFEVADRRWAAAMVAQQRAAVPLRVDTGLLWTSWECD